MDQEKEKIERNTESMSAQLKKWGIDLEKFTARASEVKAEAKTKLEGEIATLRTQMADVRKKLEEAKRLGGAASVELKIGLENAWGELKKGFENAAAKFPRKQK